MEQNTSDWHDWRRQGIGASDVPIIMKKSEFMTPFELWQQKTGRVQGNTEPNFVQQKGHTIEIIARNRYEIETGLTWEPRLVENEKERFMRASLDGFNGEANATWECKYVGKEMFAEVKRGECPEKYYPQVQYQLYITGAECCHFFVMNDNDEHAVCIVKPSEEYIQFMLGEVRAFWKLVQTDKPPKLIDQDVVELEYGTDLSKMISDYELKNNVIKSLEEEMKELKTQIFKQLPHKNCKLGGIRLQVIKSQGRVQYSKIPAIKEMTEDQLAPFKTKPSSIKKITFPRKKKND